MGILVDVSDPKWKTLSGKWELAGGSWARILLQMVNELINSTLPFSKDTFVLAFGRHFDPEVFDLCSSLVEANEEQLHIENLMSSKTKEEIINEVLDILERNGAPRVRTWLQNTELMAQFLDTTSAAAIFYYLRRSPDFAKKFVDECLPSECHSSETGWWHEWLFPVSAPPSPNSVQETMNKGKLLLSETRTAQRTAVSKDAIISVQSASAVLQTSIKNQVTVEHVGYLLNTIDPCVYRPTPLIQAMDHSLHILSDPQFERDDRVLFVLSDSQRADGSLPHQKLIGLGVTIINCFVTSKFTFRVCSITSNPKIPRPLLQSTRWDMDNVNTNTWNFHEGMFIRIL